ncbi:MAG: AAA family ATPase [Candidatus Gracilibacteria bacterium]
MFIKTLKIKNLKCFGDNVTPLEFNFPDGKVSGSGLNILVGENNTGKSTVFESIDFLRDGTKKDIKNIKNKKSASDEISVELTFSGAINDVIENFSQDNKKGVFKKYVFKDTNDKEYFRLFRTSKDIKSIQLWDNKESKFKNESGIDAPLKKLFEANFVWSDTNPNDEVSFGATTICGNLLREIVKKFEETLIYTTFATQFHKTFNDSDSGLRKELKEIEARTQKIFSEQFSDAQISFHFDELKIDSFFKNTKIEIMEPDGIPTYMEEKGSGMQRSVALALLQVYAEELIKHPENPSMAKPFFLFIDEPEICLHPQAQIKLLGAILELSKTKQIFITTHSPYFFKNNAVKNAGLFLFKKDKSHNLEVLSIKDKSWQLFPWSPSWGEINYHAYNLSTIEFHDELYGFLHQKYIDGSNDEQEAKKRSYLDEFDIYLKTKTTQTRKWTPERGWETKTEKDVSLQTFIRNKIHHPENNKMKAVSYSDDELQSSIEEMTKLCH